MMMLFILIFDICKFHGRHRAFRMLFASGESEELNDMQTVDSHNFPQPFMEAQEQLGLALAAVVRTRKDYSDSTLRSLDINRQTRPTTPMIGKFSTILT